MLHYTKIESSPYKEWIVLLHGLGGRSTLFYKQQNFLANYYNVLLIDLPGHGESDSLPHSLYDVYDIVPEITHVLDTLHIRQAHFLTFSVSTIIGNALVTEAASYIRTLTLAGPVLTFNRWTKLLIETAWHFRYFAPYMLFYKVFAVLIMPKKSHAKSRFYFVREAANLGRKEFIKWTHLLKNAAIPYKKATAAQSMIPTFYLIGRDDHLFLKETIHAAHTHMNATLHIVENAGHVCLIEKGDECNEAIHAFIQQAEQLPRASDF